MSDLMMTSGSVRYLKGPARLCAIVTVVLATALISKDVSRAHERAIKDIIPHDRVGREACFQGHFTDKAIDMERWRSPAEVASNKKDGDPGQPRNEAKPLPGQNISEVTLYLDYTDARRRHNESWDFNFTLKVVAPALGEELFARSGCAWSGWDHEKQKETTPEFMLSCWIECDGGSVRAVRSPGKGHLDLYFSRLFMQSGCEGGGNITVGVGPRSDEVPYRLTRAPLNVCSPLKSWTRD